VSRPTCRKLSTTQVISRTGLSPAMASLSKLFRYVLCYHLQALPISLATTFGISVDVFSSSY
jgi:preprotein translocase subunit SecF